jgi:hypothetical protein
VGDFSFVDDFNRSEAGLAFWNSMVRSEGELLDRVNRDYILSARGLQMLEDLHKSGDFAFVTGYLTGDRGTGFGKKTWAEGERDDEGVVHHAGDFVSEEENVRRNRNLRELIDSMGYPATDVSGQYGAPEETFLVMNFHESTKRFIGDMEGAGHLWKQESVLIVPRKSFNGGRPFFYFPETHKILFAKSSRPMEAAGQYFTLIGKDKFEYDVDWSAERHDASVVSRRMLFPIRSGFGLVKVMQSRRRAAEVMNSLGLVQKREDRPAGWEDPWKFKLVSNEELIAHMRQGHVPEDLVQYYARSMGVDSKAEGSMVAGNRGSLGRFVNRSSSTLVLDSGKDFSLFGRFEEFSAAVRKVIPDFVGDPVFLDVSPEGVAQICFKFRFLMDMVHLCFLWDMRTGSVSVSFDKSDDGGIMEFSALIELVSKFKDWFKVVLGGIDDR